MDLDARLQDATSKAIEAAKRLDRSKWPDWADNVAIFTLCRHLAVVTHSSTDANDLEPYVLAFWSATKEPEDWEAARAQFQDLWDHSKARLPVGADILALAEARAKQAKDRPAWAMLPGPKLRHLARMCWELAWLQGHSGRFFLSQRDAAKVLGTDQRTAGRMFHQLCRESVIIEADRPPKGTIKAIRYRFLKSYPSYQNASEESETQRI